MTLTDKRRIISALDVVQACALTAGTISLCAIIGYMLGLSHLYSWTPGVAMALTTAISILALALATWILARQVERRRTQ